MSVTIPPNIVSPATYADVDDLTAYWQAPDNNTRALDLLTRASNRLRMIGKNVGVDVDAECNSNPAYFSTVQWTVMEAVKRALITPGDQPSVESATITAGPYSENFKYTNPTGDLYFRKAELKDLGLYGNQHLTSISTTKRDIYSDYSDIESS